MRQMTYMSLQLQGREFAIQESFARMPDPSIQFVRFFLLEIWWGGSGHEGEAGRYRQALRHAVSGVHWGLQQKAQGHSAHHGAGRGGAEDAKAQVHPFFSTHT